MLKKLPLLVVLVLAGCNSEQKPSKSPYQTFYDTRLFFDLENEVERVPCSITGEIPSWLSGTLLRNGPAKFQVGGQRVNWLDGLAMLHAFEFSSEQVFYTNRFLRSEQYYIMMEEKSLNFSGFAQDPCPKVFKNQISRFIPKKMQDIQNADVTIQEYADKMVALTEVPLPVIFDAKTMETLGTFEFQDRLPLGQWESAHSQHDLSSGETINYCIQFGEKSSYVIWKMADHQSAREIIAEIPVELPAYMHSFALTEHYVVLVEFPFVVNPLDLMLKKKPFIFNYKWMPKKGTTFYVVSRSTGEVTTIKGDPFFAFHHVNAFDKDGKIFIDIVTHPNTDIINFITERITEKNKIKESEKTKLERFTISMPERVLSRETIFDQPTEMPRVPADRTAHEYRYSYLIDASFPTSINDQRPLYKVDAVMKTGKNWSEEGCYPGEPIFVPNPNARAEDDGVVLSLVLDFANHRSFLLILDAKDLSELARAETPHAIPVGLHGLWNTKMD